ncbi:MAG: thermonuclease family protein [Methylobacteriaceae bacterium]|nr:thermonuclease family protein [Methylobacteriaceae bacterium]
MTAFWRPSMLRRMCPIRLRRPLRLAACILLAATHVSRAHAASLVPPDSGPCSLENTARATITKIEPDLDVALSDGRILSLAGLDPPGGTQEHPHLAADAREKLAAWLEGREVAVRALADKPNRFGRVPARLFAAPPGASGAPPPVAEIGLAEATLDAGLARYRPDAAAHLCRDRLLGAESEAREAKIGLWADPAYAILPAGDRSAFADPRKGMVLVEGVVTSVGETASRLYLNFGPRRGSDFAMTLPKRDVSAFETAGIKPRELVGRRLRARGLLDTAFGPQLEISHPDAVELLD